MKKNWLWPLALAAAVLGALTAPAAAAKEEHRETMTVVLNGFPLELENPVWAEDGVTMVPVEEFCQKAGTVKTALFDSSPLPGGLRWRWSCDETNTLVVTRNDVEVTLRLWSDEMEVNGERVELPRSTELLYGRVAYVPLRPLAEALGWQVEWVGSDAVYIEEPQREKKEVRADTLEDFFNAVAPNTVITLAPGVYDLGELDVEKLDNPWAYADYEVFNGDTGDWWGMDRWSLVIRGVSDLDIRAQDVTFTTPWAYADVLRLEDCRRVGLTGLTAVHDVERGYCTGNCLELQDCETVRVMSCTLDGSGAWGLCARDSRDVRLDSCAIQNCTYGAVELDNCREIELYGCEISRCEGFALLSLSRCAGVELWRCEVHDNALGLVSDANSREVCFTSCTFRDSGASGADFGWEQSGGAVFIDCVWPEQEK